MESSGSLRRWIQWTGLVLGPVLAWITYVVLPEKYTGVDGLTSFTPAGRATLAVMAWMAVWWLTETIDISATALLPIAVFPLLGIASIGDATAPYARKLIFLFMGGFLLARSMQRWGLDRRIALITLCIVGTRPRLMVGGFMVATAVMSAFVSNTATAAMMLPIALSVVSLVRHERSARATQSPSVSRSAGDDADDGNFALCVMLGIAYAASIGGIATIIGTPPNGILVSYIAEDIAEPYRRQISFLQWMRIGVPMAVVFLPLIWLLLTGVIYPPPRGRLEGGRALIGRQYRELGRASVGEWATFVVFSLTALAWMFRPLLIKLTLTIGDQTFVPLAGLSDAGVAMIGGLILFVIPASFSSREFVMNWETAKGLPWGILILFGGGLSLAAAVEANGVAEFLASLTRSFAGARPLLLILVVAGAVIFLTELTSNTATTATLVPILAAIAPGLGVHPYVLIFPAAIAASCAFMMPVATPPNAIVFGSGLIGIPQMAKAGLWLNLIGVVLVAGLMYAVIIPLLVAG